MIFFPRQCRTPLSAVAVVLCVGAWAVGANAQTGTWDCGEVPGTVTATLVGGTLTIGGVGAMRDSDIGANDYSFSTQTKSVTDVVVESGVTYIGMSSFLNLHSLTTITISGSVTSIHVFAFGSCASLTSIDVAADNLNYSSLDGVLFNKDKTDLIQYPSGKQGAYTIPNSVTSIAGIGFQNSTGLTSITIPNGLTSIQGYSFQGCVGLASINVVSDNPNYSSVDGVLFNKNNTFLICYPVGRQGAYTIPNGVTYIDYYAFDGCSGLTSINIPNTVEAIAPGAFRSTSLISITIPNSVTYIGSDAFYNCTGLTSITVVPDNSSYSSLDGVFFNKDKTVLIQYPGGKQGAYTIPQSVISIEPMAFGECTNLTSVIILDNSVISIGEQAFIGCTGLTTVTIGNSVTDIGESAFGSCTNLTAITVLNEIPPVIYESTFDLVDKSFVSLYVPQSSISVYRSTEYWKDFTDINPIPATAAYTITFDANGGTPTMTTLMTDTDGKLTSLPTPTRGGYVFDGWYTSQSGGVKVTENTLFLEDASVYAHWTLYTAVVSPDREIPGSVPIEDAAVAPIKAFSDDVSVGPNPVKVGGKLSLYRNGGKPVRGKLGVFDAMGVRVGVVEVSGTNKIGTWNAGGVADGTYLIKGILTDVDGGRVRVSVLVSVVR